MWIRYVCAIRYNTCLTTVRLRFGTWTFVPKPMFRYQSLSYDLHVTELLKQCSQRIYLLRLLRNQGLSTDQLNTVFVGLIVSRLLYALPAWGVLVSAGRANRIDAFLKRAHKWGFCKDVTFNELLINSGSSLFQKMQSPVHCLNSLLAPKKTRPPSHMLAR